MGIFLSISIVSGHITTGQTWAFTTEEFTWDWPAVVEDFDQYETTPELLSQWSDGSSNGSNSAIAIDPLTGIVVFNYDNSVAPYYSQMTLSYAQLSSRVIFVQRQ